MEVIGRTYYRVAEHLFAVEYSKSEFKDLLGNYVPFEQTSSTDSPIFSLRITQDELFNEEQRAIYTHVFTNNANSAEEDMPRIEVYEARRQESEEVKRWMFCVAMLAKAPICCKMVCSEDFTNGVLHILPDCQDIRFCVDTALMLMYAFRTAPLMTLEMHAAVVVKEEKGYLFLGHSGTGKSTHAQMWLQAFPDTWLLNDDNPILRVMDNGEVRVYGSPWSGKTPCYNSAYARVGGVIKLSQAPHNQIRKLSLPEAYAYILSSASGLKIERQMTDNMYNTIRDVITQVGCYHMECLPNTEAAEVCFSGCKV